MKLVQCHVQVHAASESASFEHKSDPNRCFRKSFEEIRDQLLQLPSLYFEDDGSFFWTKPENGIKVWGMLYDRMVRDAELSVSSRLHYCELQGTFSAVEWLAIQDCIATENEHLILTELPLMRRLSSEEFKARWEQNE